MQQYCIQLDRKGFGNAGTFESDQPGAAYRQSRVVDSATKGRGWGGALGMPAPDGWFYAYVFRLACGSRLFAAEPRVASMLLPRRKR